MPKKIHSKETRTDKIQRKLHSNIAKAFKLEDTERKINEIDEDLCNQVKGSKDIAHFTVKLEEVIQKTCSERNGQKIPRNTKLKGKTVPLRTQKLKIMRKRTKTLR